MKEEIHNVKCAKCGENQTIAVSDSGLMTDPRFNEKHEFICNKCRKK